MKPEKRIQKKIEKGIAYGICGFRILVDLLALAIAGMFFFHYFKKANSIELYVIMTLCSVFVLFLIGTDVHMVITRDIRHIRGADRNEDESKIKKIEF